MQAIPSTGTAAASPRTNAPAANATTRTAPNRVTLSLRRLALLYLIIPLAFAFYLFDRIGLGGALQDQLPRKPDQYFLYELFFGWPHILASTIILTTNREYVTLYRKRLVVASAIVIGFFGIGEFTLDRNVLFFVAATATIIHVLKQQIGIGRGAARLNSRRYTAWGWTAIAAGVVLYNALFLSDLDPYRDQLVVLAGLLTVATVVLAARVHPLIVTGIGRLFLWSNTAMVVSALYFYAAGYGMLSIVIPRVVHDTTAFAFYIAHDANKHADQPRNGLYRVARRIPGGVYWITPALAIAVSYVLAQHGNAIFHWLSQDLFRDAVPKAISLGLLGYLGMMHYYYESFTWKTGSPYRAFISLRA